MKKVILTTTLLLGCFLACFAALNELNGEWSGTLKLDDGTVYPLKYNFKVDGDNLTGTAQTPKGELPIDDGKIDGNKFTFTVTIADIEVPHTGKFYGDSIGVDLAANGEKAHTTLIRKR